MFDKREKDQYCLNFVWLDLTNHKLGQLHVSKYVPRGYSRNHANEMACF